MSANIWTARLSYGGSDRLDITRAGADPIGVVFAPAWAILGPALAARREGRIEQAWPGYVDAYTRQMRASYRAYRPTWDSIIDRRRVVLVCACTDSTRCHRVLAARFLAAAGAEYCGELEGREQAQVSIPGVR